MKKRASFIDKNADLCQEFPFAHPRTKFLLNRTYNTHFTGPQLWDLFSKEAKMLENTWSTSIRKMFDLPIETHRYLIEPVSEAQHIKSILLKRFLSFCQQIRQSSKKALRNVFNRIYTDSQSVTGSNLRNIMFLVNKNSVDDLHPSDTSEISFRPLPESEAVSYTHLTLPTKRIV